jgi:hypothetical protein
MLFIVNHHITLDKLLKETYEFSQIEVLLLLLFSINDKGTVCDRANEVNQLESFLLKLEDSFLLFTLQQVVYL